MILTSCQMIFVKGPDKEPMLACIDQEPLVSKKQRLHHPPTVRKPSSLSSYEGKAGLQSLAYDCGGRERFRKVDDVQTCVIAVVLGLAVCNVVPRKRRCAIVSAFKSTGEIHFTKIRIVSYDPISQFVQQPRQLVASVSASVCPGPQAVVAVQDAEHDVSWHITGS